MEFTSIIDLYEIYKSHSTIVKDTRKIKNGCIFWALKGEKFDANEFAEQAVDSGASYAVIDNAKFKKDNRYILVENTFLALQNLARHHRAKQKIPIIGITGSNGKTTTKELIHSVLKEKFQTYATLGNYNNHIGVPLSILQINNSHEIAIIEMGANAKKEIEFLCSISDPNFGMITNIGKAHLEGFGGIEGVKKGKSELYRHLENKGSTVFINEDDEVLKSLVRSKNLISYGTSERSFCRGKLSQTHPNIRGTWETKNQNGVIDSQLYGEYNFYNMLAAICIGNYFKLNSNEIDNGLNNYKSTNNRSELLKHREAKIYLDAYNANPSSMQYAVNNFSKNKGSKKMIILGDMFEVGEESSHEHKSLIEFTQTLVFSQRVFVGNHFYEHKDLACNNDLFFNSTEKAKEWFLKAKIENNEILIKGSRGMKLESLIQ